MYVFLRGNSLTLRKDENSWWKVEFGFDSTFLWAGPASSNVDVPSQRQYAGTPCRRSRWPSRTFSVFSCSCTMPLLGSSAHAEPVGILSLPHLQPSWITSHGQPTQADLSGHMGNSTEWEDAVLQPAAQQILSANVTPSRKSCPIVGEGERLTVRELQETFYSPETFTCAAPVFLCVQWNETFLRELPERLNYTFALCFQIPTQAILNARGTPFQFGSLVLST